MKKVLILGLWSVLLLWGIFLTYAKDNSTTWNNQKTCDINWNGKIEKADMELLRDFILNGKGDISKHDINDDGNISIADVMVCTSQVEEETVEKTCDIDWNGKIEKADMELLRDFILNGKGDISKHDINDDGNISIADVMVCTSQVEEETVEKTCDINGDWKINKADMDMLSDFILNGNGNINKHDINNDWSISIADIMVCTSQAEEETVEKTCDINGDWKINESDMNILRDFILKGNGDLSKHDINNDWDISIADITFCTSKITEETTVKECEWMDKAKVSHTVDNDTVTLKWNAIEWNNVKIAIFDPKEEIYKEIWTAKMSDKKFSYKIKWDGEQKFKLTNWCKEYTYKVNAYIIPTKSCDLNGDWKINRTDIDKLKDLILNSKTNSKIHDFNNDWEVSVIDVTICASKITEEKTWNICDFNNDWEITISDLSRFNEHCSITKWRDSEKCDINRDWDVTIMDMTSFQNSCYKDINWWYTKEEKWEEKIAQSKTDKNEVSENWFTEEMNDAYEFAYKNWITTIKSIEKTKMYWTLTRIQMAKMLSNYAINVLWKQPDTSKKCEFIDISNELDAKYDFWVTKACQLWIMWQNMKNNEFKAFRNVTRAEFATALSRMLYEIEDGKWNTKYYEPHTAVLYNEWIINNTDPNLKEKRWYVMLMLKRTEETAEKTCDFNDDWKIDESDINIISDLILNGRDNISKFDINWDGEISVTDVTICSEKFN